MTDEMTDEDDGWETDDELRIAAHWKRLEGKEPGPKTELQRVLTVIRHRPGLLTSDISIARAMHTDETMKNMRVLMKRKLVARQTPLPMGIGSFESTWTPLETDKWKPR